MAAEVLLFAHIGGALLGQDLQLGFHGKQFLGPEVMYFQESIVPGRGN